MTADAARPHRLVVALDGPASSGKSSVGSAAARRLGYRFCDTGLFYRALTFLALELGHEPGDPAPLVADLGRVELGADEKGRFEHVFLDGGDVTEAVHTPAVDRRVSEFSAIREVRAALVPRQRELAAGGGIIMAGRDIGTAILPDADLKVYLDASPEERARRRCEERGLGPDDPEAVEILEELRRRDMLDSTRAIAPLRPAPDAHIVRTDGNAFEQTVSLVVDAIRDAEDSTGRRASAPRPSHATPDPARATGTGSSSRRKRVAPGDIHDRVGPGLAALLWFGRLASHSFARIRLERLDRLPRRGPLILAVNHISNADPVVLGSYLTPALRRRIHWLGKRELFDWPVIGWVARHGGVLPVDRAAADLEAFRTASRVLEEGHILLVFPEGTRSPTGQLQHAKDGLATLALRTGAPIVPIGISGTDRVWPKGGLPRPGGRITVRVGEPLRLAEVLGTTSGRRAKAAATDLVMRRIAALLEPRHRGAYADETPVTVAGAVATPER
ncbi:MAG: (d)CMP kinase [Chloroflexota bacterium]